MDGTCITNVEYWRELPPPPQKTEIHGQNSDFSESGAFAINDKQKWIIAYCPDTDEFFATDQREFFWEYDRKFSSESAAVSFFESHISDFLDVKNNILKDCIMGYKPRDSIYLANTQKFYRVKKC